MTGPSTQDPAWAPFRPRRARRTALGFAAAQAVVLLSLVVLLPAAGVPFGWIDVSGTVAIAAGVGWVLLRFALVRAEPRPGGLVVQNLVRRTELAWEQVVAVRFGGGDPWLTLDLSDGDVLPVMAVQRSDGDRGRAEARRLATLVAANTATSTGT